MSKINILVVEDEFIIADYLKECLQNSGYNVLATCEDYDTAIQHLQKLKIDIALIDITIKGSKNGIAIANYINEFLKTPFVFTTSHGDKKTIDEAKQTYPYAYLIKPFTQDDLYAVIETALMQAATKNNHGTVKMENVLIINDGIFIKNKSKFEKLNLDEILYIKANDNYVSFYTSSSYYTIKNTLQSLTNSLPDNFLRTHKSYIVNITHLTKFDSEEINIGNIILPLSRLYYNELLEKLKIIQG